MNIIDIIILCLLGVGLIAGLRQGLVLQLSSLVGFLVLLFVAQLYAAQLGTLLSISEEYSTMAGYAIIIIVGLITVGLISRMLKSIVKFAGLGALDRLLGGFISVAKYALIISVIFSVISTVGIEQAIVDKEVRAESKLYEPMKTISQNFMPAINLDMNLKFGGDE